VVGTSLGGFWARVLNIQCNVPALCINPAIAPSVQLRRHVGIQTNFSTGEVYEFTEKALQQYAVLESLPSGAVAAPYGSAIFQGDEVIDVARTCAELQLRGASTTLLPGGQHRISKNEIPLLVPLIRQLEAFHS
jgi:uncharacterized protein